MLLLTEPKTAQILSKEIKKDRSSVSRALLDLSAKKLVVCENPKEKRYRFYKLTADGKKVTDELKKLGL
jgi:DNA-binding MarR family transcriptional regulator